MSAPIRQHRPTHVFRNGYATAALALGIVGAGLVLTAMEGPLAVTAAVLAIVFGVLGIVRAQRDSVGDAGMAFVGALAGVLAMVQFVTMFLS